jgi:hypothetical protein
MRERPLRFVPRSALVFLVLSLSLQLGWHYRMGAPHATAEDFPAAPSLSTLNLASFGDQIALSKLLMLYVQSFDNQAAGNLPYRKLDYNRLCDWLSRVIALNPRAQYPLFVAGRVYADVNDEKKQRVMLDFIYQQFLADPNRRWPALAQATILAKHRLKDLPLARSYAQAIRLHATGKEVPSWAKQMEIFILQDMNELESAKILIGGLLNNGEITDPNEIRFLKEKLNEMEHRTEPKQ